MGECLTYREDCALNSHTEESNSVGIHLGEGSNINYINTRVLVYLQQLLLAPRPRLARFCHHCSLTTPLEAQGWRIWNGCRVWGWGGKRERGSKMHLRHKQKVQRLKMNSKVAGKEEKHDQQSWGGRCCSPGLFLASGIQIIVGICLRTVTVPSTKWKKKRKGRLTWEGWSFLLVTNSRFEGKCPWLE